MKSLNSRGNQPGRAEVLDALALLLNSDNLKRAPAQQKILRYIVQRTLDGEASNLKAYTIAVEALGRKDGFDPGTDPIVRVQAMRLRRILSDYYENEGASGLVRILLPTGRYVPEFSYRPLPAKDIGNDASPDAESGDLDGAPVISLVFVQSATLAPYGAQMAASLIATVEDAITRFGFIHWTESLSRIQGATKESVRADFVVRINLDAPEPGQGVVFAFQVWETDSESVICQERFFLSAPDSLDTAVRQFCTMVLGHPGCIHRYNLTRLLSGKAFQPRYEIKLRYLDVVRTFGDQARENALRQLLESQLQYDFGFTYGYAFLSHLLYRQALTYPAGHSYDELMLRALHLSLRATELSQNNSFTYATLYWIADIRGDKAIASAALRTALRLNPYDDDIQLTHGCRLICSGQPAYGVELIERSMCPDVPYPGRNLVFLALGKFLLGDTEAAAQYGMRVPSDAQADHQSMPGAFIISAIAGHADGGNQGAASADAMRRALARSGLDLSQFLRRIISHDPSRHMIEQAFEAASRNTL